MVSWSDLHLRMLMEAMLEDQASEQSEKTNYNFQSSKNLTRHHTHHQVEYGAKKYIKP